MDETSVLEYTIMYLKQMQDRVKFLEKQQAIKQRMESLVQMKKSKQQHFVEDEGSSDEVGSNDQDDEDSTPAQLPEIKVKVSDKTVLMKIHCKKSKGVLVNLLVEVESFNLAVSSTNVSTFGNLALNITIIAEMEGGYNMTMNELVKALQSAVQLPPQEV